MNRGDAKIASALPHKKSEVCHNYEFVILSAAKDLADSMEVSITRCFTFVQHDKNNERNEGVSRIQYTPTHYQYCQQLLVEVLLATAEHVAHLGEELV